MQLEFLLGSQIKPVSSSGAVHENGFQMEVVIERDLEDDGLFLGRVERRWHGHMA